MVYDKEYRERPGGAGLQKPDGAENGTAMAGAAVFVYGLLMSFIFSGASRNAKLRRPNPPVMQYLGYVLCGLTAGASITLFAHALGVPLLPLTI
jgi:hypothetical protein